MPPQCHCAFRVIHMLLVSEPGGAEKSRAAPPNADGEGGGRGGARGPPRPKGERCDEYLKDFDSPEDHQVAAPL